MEGRTDKGGRSGTLALPSHSARRLRSLMEPASGARAGRAKCGEPRRAPGAALRLQCVLFPQCAQLIPKCAERIRFFCRAICTAPRL